MKKIVLVLAVLATSVLAYSPPHTHSGFFLNIALGMGIQSFDYKYNSSSDNITLEAEGPSVDFDFKVGGCVAQNLAIHGTLVTSNNLSDIEVTVNDKTETVPDVSEHMILIGAGMTFYFAGNMLVTGSLGLSRFTVNKDDSDSDDDDIGSSEFGFGFQMGFGKEWWIGGSWGMGILGTLLYGSADDKDNLGDMSAFAMGVKFSVTFN